MVRLSVDHNHHTQSNTADMTCNKKVHCLLNQRHMCSCEVCIHRLSMNKSTINRNANCATVWRMLEEEIGDERKGDARAEYEPYHNEHSRGQLYLPISVCTQEHIHRKKFKLIKLISLGYDTQSSAFEIASTLLQIYSEFMKMVGELARYAASQWADKWSSWSKALFQGVIFYEPVLHQALSEIIVQLKKGSREGPKSKDFTQLLQRFVHFCDEMLQPIENKPLQTLINECWTDHSTDPERPNRYYHSVPLHMEVASNELIAPPSGYNIVTPLQGVTLPVLSTSAIPTQDCTNLFAEMPFGSFSFAPQEHQNFSYSLSRPNLLKQNPITSMKHVAAMIHPPSIPSDESSMVSSDDEVQVTLSHDNLPSEYFGADDVSSSTKIFNPLDHRSFPTSLGDQSVIFHDGHVLPSDKIPADMRAFPFGKFKCDRTAATAESGKKTESTYQQLDLSGSHISPTYPTRFGFSSPQMPPFMTPPDFSAPSMPLFPPATENPLCFASSHKAAVSQEFINQNSGVLNLLEKAAAHPAMFGNQPKFPTLRNYTVTPTTTTSTSVQNRKKLVAHSKLRHGLQDKQTVKGDSAKLQQNFLCQNHADGGVDLGNSIVTNSPHELQDGSNVDRSPQHEAAKPQVPENHTLISDAPNTPTAGISDETSNDPCHKESDPSSCTRGSECKITGTGATLGGATKYCDCCYCEFFGNGGPTVAPTSKNYAEMRERLRQKLKQRKDYSQNGKSDCHSHHGKHGSHHYLEDRPLDEILSFIEGDQDRMVPGTKKAQKKNKGKEEDKKRAEKQENMAFVKNEVPTTVEKGTILSGNANKQVQNKKKKKKKNPEERNSSPNATLLNSTVKKDTTADTVKGKAAEQPGLSHSKSKNVATPADLRNGHESGALSKSSQPEKNANEEISNRKNDSKRKTGNAARAEQHAEKKTTQSQHSASFDHVFLPKDGRDGSEMDDIEKEIDSFKRFCLDSQTKVREKKIKVNWKDFSFKKVHSSH